MYFNMNDFVEKEYYVSVNKHFIHRSERQWRSFKLH